MTFEQIKQCLNVAHEEIEFALKNIKATGYLAALIRTANARDAIKRAYKGLSEIQD